MQVRVRSQAVVFEIAAAARLAATVQGAVCLDGRRIGAFLMGIVKLVPAPSGSGRAEKNRSGEFDLPVTQSLVSLPHGAGEIEHSGHGKFPALAVRDGPHQIHESAAFGVHWLAAPAESQDFFAHGSVAGQPFGVGFGVTAPQIQAVQGRGQVHILQRRKGHQFGSGLAQAAQILLVVKTEGPVPGVADANFRNPGPAVRD